jgi:polar amino acid transport system substrate-binding protein
MKERGLYSIFVYFITAMLIMSFAAPGWTSTVAEIKARKKLIVLCHPDQLAFARETSRGQYDGLDIAIMKTLANSLGVALEIKALDNFGDLIPALLKNEGDVIASSMTITEERQKLVSFSMPYFPVVMMAIVRNDSDITGSDKLDGKKGSVTKGTIHEARLKQIPEVEIVYAEDSNAQYEAVKSGKADFALFDSNSVVGMIDQYPGLKIAFHFPEHYDYGFAVAPGSDLLAPMNAHIKTMQDSGSLYTMIRRYLGDRAFKMLEMIK